MSDQDAAKDGRAQRRTWVIGGVLPSPWRWAPAWGLGASATAWIASMTIVMSADVSSVVRIILFDLPGVCVLFLGVLAIVLGARATRHPAPSQPAEDSAVGG
ncbi:MULTISPECIES: hypothetical protein [unclassified Microbacterium]|uniref:hypothetical protein n=1 Tax=unclassified Microbacterium TaxID=2609290 RepID=UPI0012FC914C|nr:hypothetical protein [Microbacterium sp. MAH-37]MVQ43684.1 hypothetical protein [Microbacterium sp. MAH-37]